MNEFFIPFGQLFSAFRSKLKGAYQFGYDIIHAATQFGSYGKDSEKLAMVLSNPAVLKVFALQCDLFSMGRVYVCDKEGKEIENDPFITLVKEPNPFTKTEAQFLWDFMFWNMLGTSYTYVDSALVDRPKNKMYFLNPAKIEWPLDFNRKKDKMVFSDAEVSVIKKAEIVYRYEDGTAFRFSFDRLVINFDLTNSIGNFFKSPSRLDALHKIVSNSEHVLDSENINIRYTSKFMVGADNQVGATTKKGITEDERNDIVNKIDHADKSVYPVNAKINIERFVKDLAALQLDKEYLHQYFLIGNMYGIPRDVLEAYNSATYENQEKARAAHVNYTLEPKGNQFMDSYEVHFGYKALGKNIKITWDHLPFVQVFAKEKAETSRTNVETLDSLLKLGVSLDDANQYLGTEFSIEQAEEGVNTETIKAQANLRGSVGGVQGIINIQTGVSQGTISRESAQGILMVVYGFTKEEATQILGPEIKPQENGQTQSGQGEDPAGNSEEEETS